MADFGDDIPINLAKKGKDVEDVLVLRKIEKPPVMRVVTAFDISGSMTTNFLDGSVQQIFDQLMGVSLKFDDNGELDCFAFNEDSHRMPTAAPRDFGKYVASSRMRANGGTNYAPPIREIIDEMFATPQATEEVISPGGFLGIGRKVKRVEPTAEEIATSRLPVFAIFITDGAASDKDEAKRLIIRSQDHPIWWNVISIGEGSIDKKYLNEIGSLPNCAYEHFNNARIDDKTLYSALISDKFANWARNLKSAQPQARFA